MFSPRALRLESLELRSLLAAVCPVTTDSSLSAHIAVQPSQPSLSASGTANALVARAVAAAVTDDAHENNDTFALASNLGTLTDPKTIDKLVMNDAADVAISSTFGLNTLVGFKVQTDQIA